MEKGHEWRPALLCPLISVCHWSAQLTTSSRLWVPWGHNDHCRAKNTLAKKPSHCFARIVSWYRPSGFIIRAPFRHREDTGGAGGGVLLVQLRQIAIPPWYPAQDPKGIRIHYVRSNTLRTWIIPCSKRTMGQRQGLNRFDSWDWIAIRKMLLMPLSWARQCQKCIEIHASLLTVLYKPDFWWSHITFKNTIFVLYFNILLWSMVSVLNHEEWKHL